MNSKPSAQFGQLQAKVATIYFHGTAGDWTVSAANGLHIGTYQAAKDALNAKIGTPTSGDWDGTRVYGETLLMCDKSLEALGEYATGYTCQRRWKNPNLEGDFFPDGTASYSDGTPIPLDVRPIIFPVRIIGPMTNTPHTPHDDFQANGYMRAAITRGHAKSGYYYRNIAEDEGSISVVVPTCAHLVRLDLEEIVKRAA